MGIKHLSVALCLVLANAKRLDKPALHKDLEYCKTPLLDALKPTDRTIEPFQDGWLPKDCVEMTNDADLDPQDVKAWTVRYSDCNDGWVLCHHKDAPDTFETMVDMFGRLPVHTRQWVRHVIALPDEAGGHAYNSNGNIAMFAGTTSSITVFIHEAGHSLDLLDAFPDKPLSNSTTWTDAYDQDSAVPDPYAQSNQVENVAQNIVVATFDQNVEGGFASIEAGWKKIEHQLNTVSSEADKSDKLLRPGGTCTHRLENSECVQVGAQSRIKRFETAPNVDLSNDVIVVKPTKRYDTRDIGCALNKAK